MAFNEVRMSAPLKETPKIADPELRLGYSGWRVALASSFASMAGFGSILIYSFGIFLKPLSTQFGWTRETISTAFACASFTLGICSPALGWLLDRYGPRRIVIFCLVTFGLAFSSVLGRYFGLPSLGTLYGFMWTAYAVAAALGSVLLGRAFDSTGSYAALLIRLACFTSLAGVLMLGMPRYPKGADSPERSYTLGQEPALELGIPLAQGNG
jgi:cyanate permease